jgi:hypothetical protein
MQHKSKSIFSNASLVRNVPDETLDRDTKKPPVEKSTKPAFGADADALLRDSVKREMEKH